MRTHTPRPTASTRGRRLSALGAAVTLALGGVAACDGAADSANDSTRPDTDPSSTEAGGDPSPIEADAALPEPMPLKGPISACDLLLPVEVGLYLAMDPPTVREEMLMGTSTCTYLSEGSPVLITQLVPATLSLREQLDLAMLGMHPVERFDFHGQPAAAGSDGYGVTTLGVAVEERDSVYSVAASDYADGMLPGTDELAVPGDQRVMDAQRDAAEELVEIALVRLGVSEG